MHQEFEALLLPYTTGSLNRDDQRRLEAHLQHCEACRAALAEWRTIATATRLAAHQRAASLPPLRLDRLEQERVTMQIPRPMAQRRTFMPATLVAAAAIFSLVATLFLAPKPNSNNTLFQGTSGSTPSGVFVELVMPARNIENGSVIQADDVMLIPFPEESVPFSGLTSVDDAIGKIARTNIYCNQPIFPDMLVDNALDIAPYTVPPIGEIFDCTARLAVDFELIEVAVALVDIPRGQIIPRNSVRLRTVPSTLAPAVNFMNLDEVVGSIAQYTIYREQVITSQMLYQASDFNVPTGKVAVALNDVIPIYGMQSTFHIYAYTVGELEDRAVDAPLTSQNGAYYTPPMLTRVAENAQIVGGNNVLVVAVSPDEAILLNRLNDAGFRLTLVDADLVEAPTSSDSNTSMTLPEGMVEVAVPVSHITAVPYVIREGIEVAVIASMLLVDTDENMPAESEQAGRPQLTTQQIVHDAVIMGISTQADNTDVITLAVSPQDAEIMLWIIEADIPITLVPASKAGQFGSPQISVPPVTPTSP